jgi:serine protease AprX
VQQDHPDFDGIMMHTTADVQSHGTSTFGIVFGNGNRDGDGNAQATGHMPSSTGCASQGIFADYGVVGDRFAHTQQLKQSPYFASFQSNSWGGGLTTLYNSTSQQMDDIIWRLDIAITQSQSNAGTRQSRPQAWAKNIISVGGIRHFNTLSITDDSWTGGASIGPAEDGRIKPDVSYWYDSIFTTNTGSGYTSGFGGTSAATPETAGVLGLMVQMWSENVWGTNPTGTTVFERQPHAQTIKALLVNNAWQWPFSGATHDLTRVHQGWGRPNARLARERAARSFVVNESTPLQVGQLATYTIEVVCHAGTGCGQVNGNRNQDLRVTLAYPDPPGTTSATLHRINDLSLRVVSPSGTVYHGNNGLLVGTTSTAGGSPNTIDTVENVLIPNAQVGNWTVEVRAAEINQDAYPTTPAADAVFALVVTGGRPPADDPSDR